MGMGKVAYSGANSGIQWYMSGWDDTPKPELNRKIKKWTDQAHKGEVRKLQDQYKGLASTFSDKVNTYKGHLNRGANKAERLSNEVSNTSISDLSSATNSNGRFSRNLFENSGLGISKQNFSAWDDYLETDSNKLKSRRNDLQSKFSRTVRPETADPVWKAGWKDNADGSWTGGEKDRFVYNFKTPNLDSVYTPDRGRYERNRDSYFSGLDSLFNERRSEEQRILNYGQNLSRQANQYASQLDGLDFTDSSRINYYDSRLDRINQRANSFSSPILNELKPNGFTSVQQAINNARSGISGLEQQRQQERSRVDDFTQSLESGANNLYQQANDLTIADTDQFDDIRQGLQSGRQEASSFDTPLNIDTSGAENIYSNINNQLETLEGKRNDELNRINNARTQFRNSASVLGNEANRTEPYDLSDIEALRNQAGEIRSDVSGFSSLLPTDFSGVQDRIGSAENAIDNLADRRASNLGQISDSIEEPLAGLDDVPLYEESEFNARNQTIDDIQGRLDRYSGGDVESIEAEITNARGKVDSRLEQLTNRRSQIAQEAQALAEEIKSQDFYAKDELTGPEGSAQDIEAEADLYKAQQAMDDIDAMMSEIQSERQRLEADAEAVQARRNQAQSRIGSQVDQNGVPRFQDNRVVDPSNIKSFMERFVNTDDDEEQTESASVGASNPFSNSLGIIRVG